MRSRSSDLGPMPQLQLEAGVTDVDGRLAGAGCVSSLDGALAAVEGAAQLLPEVPGYRAVLQPVPPAVHGVDRAGHLLPPARWRDVEHLGRSRPQPEEVLRHRPGRLSTGTATARSYRSSMVGTSARNSP